MAVEAFKERLNLVMKETGKTKKVIAEEAGITYASFYGYLLGTTLPSCEVLVQLSDYFNVSADYLLGRAERDECTPTSALSRERDLLKYEIVRLRKGIAMINHILEKF